MKYADLEASNSIKNKKTTGETKRGCRARWRSMKKAHDAAMKATTYTTRRRAIAAFQIQISTDCPNRFGWFGLVV
ncbi:hypothetical protein HanIR_Chr14g0713591 [Helianthus annuus]|nr:hypothetical protein HanIR_Chr14g0713591 [Helianthus annuus]